MFEPAHLSDKQTQSKSNNPENDGLRNRELPLAREHETTKTKENVPQNR